MRSKLDCQIAVDTKYLFLLFDFKRLLTAWSSNAGSAIWRQHYSPKNVFIFHLYQIFPFFLSNQIPLLLTEISLHIQGNLFLRGGWVEMAEIKVKKIVYIVILFSLTELFVIV